MPDGPARSPSLLAPLRHRDFRLLWIGACASLAGDGVFLIALAWQAYTLSHTPTALALLGLCATVPQLLALLGGGILSDRVGRRRILLAADVLRFMAVLFVAVLVLSGHPQMWQLAALSVAYGLGAGIAAPAFDAIVPDLVPDQDLQQANALDLFLRPAMLRLAGPALGGVLIAVHGPGTAFLFDAVTFLVSALCVRQMSTRPGAVDPAESEGTLIGAQRTFVAAGVLCAAVTFAALFLPHMRDADGALETARRQTLQGQKQGQAS